MVAAINAAEVLIWVVVVAMNAARVRRKERKKSLRCLLIRGRTAAGGRRGCIQGCGRAGVRMRDRQKKKKKLAIRVSRKITLT